MESFPKTNTIAEVSSKTEYNPVTSFEAEDSSEPSELGERIGEVAKAEGEFGDEVNSVVTSLVADIEKLPEDTRGIYIEKIQRALDEAKKSADKVVASAALALAMNAPALAGEPDIAPQTNPGTSTEQKMEYSYIPSVTDIKIILEVAETSLMSKVELMTDDKIPTGKKVDAGLNMATTATHIPC